jgi:2-oxoglutarate dehydrogenase E2 component (dihydrolipoamide succinyltransferase)
MPIEIKLPKLGESVVEGTVGRWLKRPGDRVEQYEPLLEVVTDKVDTEVPAPAAGVLREIVVPEGSTVRVGTLLAVLDDGEAGDQRSAATVQRSALAEANAQPQPSSAAAQPGERSTQHSFVSPVVARLVAEHGLDLSQIRGTGQGGRITKQDVMRYLESVARGQGPGGREMAGQGDTEAGGQGASGMALAAIPQAPSSELQAPVAALPEDAELVPLTAMRRMIAEHMVRSVRTAPHVTTVMEVDVGRIVAHRAQHRAAFERQGVRLTFTPYFVQAAAAALREVPLMNASFRDDGIVLHRQINIGVAVALDEGLIVPVIRDADEKNLLGLARAVNDLAERARGRRLRPDETQGGTFTISNHGVGGSLFATPIINQPQAGILGIGAIQKRAVVVSGGGVDAIAIRPMCYLSLTFDHRVMDGAAADHFLGTVKRFLEEDAG